MICYSTSEMRDLKNHLRKYMIHHQRNNIKPLVDIIASLLGLCLAIILCSINGFACILVAGFTVRVFIIFHDCTHNCFFKHHLTKNYNQLLASILEPFVITSPKQYKEDHYKHHEKVDRAFPDDPFTTVISLPYFHTLSENKKKLYNLFRSPVIFFSLCPIYLFWIKKALTRQKTLLIKYTAFLSIVATLGGCTTLLYCLLGQYIAAITGILLFHLQHQVNTEHGFQHPRNLLEKDYQSLLYATHLKIPWFLQWVTHGIEYHHIHHLNSQIPCYAIKKCQQESGELLKKVPLIKYKQALKSLAYTLYDDTNMCYISFRQYKKMKAKSKQK